MLDILVCGVPEVDDLIDEVEGVISIMNPGYTIFAPQSIASMEAEDRYSVLRLEFDDVWQESYQLGQEMVTPEIIYSALDFAAGVATRYGDDTGLLVHCHEGISRSSAIAIAIYINLGCDPSEAVERVTHLRPQAVPNVEVIRQTDRLLDMNGKLYDEVYNVCYQSSPNSAVSL